MQIDTPNKIYTPAKPDSTPVMPTSAVKPVKEQKQDQDQKKRPRTSSDADEVDDGPSFDDYA